MCSVGMLNSIFLIFDYENENIDFFFDYQILNIILSSVHHCQSAVDKMWCRIGIKIGSNSSVSDVICFVRNM